LNIKGEKTAKKLTELQNSEEFIIFRHFSKDYYLIDGHKFGSLFLAYDEDPDKSHAKYLIFTGKYDINHLTRLAAACKKVGLYAHLENG
jgi:tRNA splicing endonuclease